VVARTSPAIDSLTVRLAAMMIAYDGRLPAAKAKNMAKRCGFIGELPHKPTGEARGQICSVVIRRAAAELLDEGLIRRDGLDWVADDLSAVAAWLAEVVDGEYRPVVGAPHPATVERRESRTVRA
jgi:hypothetical protein